MNLRHPRRPQGSIARYNGLVDKPRRTGLHSTVPNPANRHGGASVTQSDDKTPSPRPALDQFGSLDDVPEIYVDAMNLYAGPYTFSIVLGTKKIGDTGAKPRIVVHLSPQMAAKTVDLLGNLVAQYEKSTKVRIRPRKPAQPREEA